MLDKGTDKRDNPVVTFSWGALPFNESQFNRNTQRSVCLGKPSWWAINCGALATHTAHTASSCTSFTRTHHITHFINDRCYTISIFHTYFISSNNILYFWNWFHSENVWKHKSFHNRLLPNYASVFTSFLLPLCYSFLTVPPYVTLCFKPKWWKF